ncbi:ChtB-like [Operophtera brumata nucleopolyhedrovirus]|uniref:ChtB-like n=1 Tax=Operophtera brumata nucleopolyhedrovirus TaxID=1046267 RepID=A0A2H4UZP2_9ABAC|nr:ChtB-like [Operophtera brumata nucleopolyhedrovirus]AUA60241.1 ChtB-like [Operophtera brumata nucleopolyhedrovirus]
MWFLVVFFILLKIIIFKKLQAMHVDAHHNKICPDGYHGLNADPFDCNSYYSCPGSAKFFCESDQQFDLDTKTCIDTHFDVGCVGKLNRNLLL